MPFTGAVINPGSNPGELPPDSVFWNSAHEFTRLPLEVVITEVDLTNEAPVTEESIAEALNHGIKKGPEAEDARWQIVARRALGEPRIPIVEQLGVLLVLEASGLEVGKPSIDPSRFEDAA